MIRTLSVFILFAGAWLTAQSPAFAEQPAPPSCRTWQACRDLSRAAAERGQFETAHDLAWRALQHSMPRAEELMLLLARMQSLSGRPDDALVMLRRLAEIGGVAPDALMSDDFRPVRERPGWVEVEALLRLKLPSPAAVTASAAATAAPAPTVVAPRAIEKTPAVADIPRIADAIPPEGIAVDEVLRFPSFDLIASALAVDRVSSRFLIGARDVGKVVAVGEQTNRAVDLVRADSAQFYDVMALDIDRRRGDLWVASSQPPRRGSGPATSDGSRSAIHRLQLISGRPLALVPVTSADGVRLVDLAVTDSGSVLALDAPGRRIWEVRPGRTNAEVVALLDVWRPRSLTVTAGGRRAYVAHETGIVTVDLASESVAAVAAPAGTPLEGFERLRGGGGTLLGVQRGPDGRPRVVRLVLDRAGTRVVRRDVVDESLGPGAPSPALTMLETEFFYTMPVARPGPVAPDVTAIGAEMIVRRARVK